MKRNGLVRFIAIVLFVVGFLALLGGIFGGTAFANGGFGNGWGPGSRSWLAWPFIAGGLTTALFVWFLGAVLWLLGDISNNLAEARARGVDLRAGRRAQTRGALQPAGSMAAPGAAAAGGVPAGAAVAAGAVAAGAIAAGESAESKPAPAAPPPAPTVAIPAVVAAAVPDKAEPAPEAEQAETVSEADAAAAEAAPETPVADVAAADAAAQEAGAAASEAAAEAAPETPAADAAAVEAADAPPRAPQAEISDYDLDEGNGTGDEGPAGEFSGRLPGSDEAARIAGEMAAQKPANGDNPPAAVE